MLRHAKEKKLALIINIVYSIFIIFLIYFFIKYVFKLFFPFILALIISLFAEKFVVIFIKKFNIKRCISSIICISILYLAFFAFISLFSVIIVRAFNTLTQYIPDCINRIEQYFVSFASKAKNAESGFISRTICSIFDYVKTLKPSEILTGSIGSKLFSPISELVISLPSFLLSFVIMIVSSFFISISLPEIKTFIASQISSKKIEFLSKTKSVATSFFKKYLKAYLILASATFTELIVLFYIFKIKPTVIMAFIVSLVDILPIFGVGAILIPWAIISFIIDSKSKAVVLLTIYVLVTVIRQILEPKIVGKSLGLNPIIVIISIYLGFKLFGIAGIIILPLLVILTFELQNAGVIQILGKKTIDKS